MTPWAVQCFSRERWVVYEKWVPAHSLLGEQVPSTAEEADVTEQL